MTTLASSSALSTITPLPAPPDRLTFDEALRLFREADLFELGIRATEAKRRYHAPQAPITFVIDRNVNYTNICNVDCSFCAFYRHEGDEDAYVLPYEVIAEKAQQLLDANGTQFLLQGGVHPDLPFEYYTDLVSRLRADFPALTIHAFSPTEISYMAKITGQSLAWVLERLKEAGLSSIPGGGAEILHDDVRRKVSHKKVDSHDWLEVMEAAHGVGLRTTATMMFGMVEKDWHIIDHLFKVRDLQDKAGGFTAFIPWTFQRENTRLQKLPVETTATGVDYLKVIAMARLVLDNVPNIQSSWLTQGTKLCQTALYFGANDIGGVVMEENVVTAAGIKHRIHSLDEVLKLIHGTGADAAQRDTAYNILRHYPHPAKMTENAAVAG
jgi:cyclic dehypoxanthinyl futalosine synthase